MASVTAPVSCCPEPSTVKTAAPWTLPPSSSSAAVTCAAPTTFKAMSKLTRAVTAGFTTIVRSDGETS